MIGPLTGIRVLDLSRVLGEYARQILGELLGYDSRHIDDLASEGCDIVTQFMNSYSVL